MSDTTSNCKEVFSIYDVSIMLSTKASDLLKIQKDLDLSFSTDNQGEYTYDTAAITAFQKIIELMDVGFSNKQIKLLLPFLSKISSLNSEGILLLKSKLEANGFNANKDNSEYETHLDVPPTKEEEPVDFDSNYSENALTQSNSLDQILEGSINQGFQDFSKQLARNVAIAVSKEMNMHILSIKSEQDLRITALENSMKEYKAMATSSNNKPAFHRNSKKNRSSTTCIPVNY